MRPNLNNPISSVTSATSAEKGRRTRVGGHRAFWSTRFGASAIWQREVCVDDEHGASENLGQHAFDLALAPNGGQRDSVLNVFVTAVALMFSRLGAVGTRRNKARES
jgi:hypothetical protein